MRWPARLPDPAGKGRRQVVKLVSEPAAVDLEDADEAHVEKPPRRVVGGTVSWSLYNNPPGPLSGSVWVETSVAEVALDLGGVDA